jgi:DNA-binding response OmpR family regulator
MKNVLVIEDESSIADTIAHGVEREGYAAVRCERGLEGLERLKAGDSGRP